MYFEASSTARRDLAASEVSSVMSEESLRSMPVERQGVEATPDQPTL